MKSEQFFREEEEKAYQEETANPYTALLEYAGGIIANAWGGDWSKASEEWREAAERWRDKYHEVKPENTDSEVEPGKD